MKPAAATRPVFCLLTGIGPENKKPGTRPGF
jgi:hypothetical protein